MWLRRAGHTVRTFKTTVDPKHHKVAELLAAGCSVDDIDPALTLRQRMLNRVLPYQRQHTRRSCGERVLTRGLRAFEPHLVVVSQGSNYDGIAFAEVCRQQGHAYVLLSQKAVDFFLPLYFERTLAQRAYATARRCYFVARHNMVLTEQQLAMRLPAAEVVTNPFNVPFEALQPWPAAEAEQVLHLACVARFEVLDKGQDLLLQVLSQPHWRARALRVTLFGAGHDEQALREMIDLLDLHETVRIGGHVRDISAVWRSYHALVLPSRNEGLPLALVEAMLSGRPAIAVSAGGMAELLTDNVTGFLAAAPTPQALEEALERAWNQRARWPELGREAARRARAAIPADAAARFGERLLAEIAG
ncbi:hypothetical protein B0919_18745 [Hymenobacter sp. CRA2]|nr:hypothetical protein B0919_18745 [Hymenobacter sp. CRA2]